VSGSWESAARELLRGGLVIYPTETFYALGCLATLHPAAERIFEVKGRPGDKPLPLIIADWDMAGNYLRLGDVEMELARAFWPGPLSIVTEVDPSVSPLARDGSGRSAVRMSPHPVAAGLCLAAGAPLVSSSANLSGRAAVSRPGDLDPELLRRSGALVLDDMPWPAGGLPSTLVEVAAGRSVRVLRPGALPASAIAGKGFDVTG
jgi:L-threonylcarbamoyladenylate synthase